MTRNSELNCEDLFGCDHRPENQIELRSWSGLASEVTDIIDFCPVAPDGTALAIIRVIASTQVWR